MLYLYLKRDMLFTCYSIQAGGVHHWCGIYSDVMGSQALRVDLPAHVQLIGDGRHRGDGRGVAWHQYLLREVSLVAEQRDVSTRFLHSCVISTVANAANVTVNVAYSDADAWLLASMICSSILGTLLVILGVYTFLWGKERSCSELRQGRRLMRSRPPQMENRAGMSCSCSMEFCNELFASCFNYSAGI